MDFHELPSETNGHNSGLRRIFLVCCVVASSFGLGAWSFTAMHNRTGVTLAAGGVSKAEFEQMKEQAIHNRTDVTLAAGGVSTALFNWRVLAVISAVAAICYYLIKARPKKIGDLPKKMKRLLITNPNPGVTPIRFDECNAVVVEVDVPQPGKHQVLVKMVASAVNPSDEGDIKRPEGPAVVYGREGCGIVVASGGGVMAGGLVGQKVGVAKAPPLNAENPGMWQEYVCLSCMPPAISVLDQALPTETAASFLVNPCTAMGIFDTVQRRERANVFIHTVGSSALGKMMVKLAPKYGLTIVNMVRGETQAAQLRALGAKYVVIQQEGWEGELAKLITELKIRVIFDAIAGDMVGTLLSMLPPEGVIYNYGGLSGKPIGNIKTVELCYDMKRMEGWYLKTWLTEGGTLSTIMRIRRCFKVSMPGLGQGGWAETAFQNVSIEDMWHALSVKKSNDKLRIMLG